MPQLDFLINRLMRMSVPELAHRVSRKAGSMLERRAEGKYSFDTAIVDYDRRLFGRRLEYADPDKIVEKADRISKHRFDLFALKDFFIGEEIDYHTDHRHDMSAPAHVFGKAIDYRDSGRIGDIKYIWELNRHLFLLPLAMAYDITGDTRYIDKFSYFLREWLKQNRFMKGVNWCSSLELGIRLINWTLCWHMLKDAIDEELKASWMDSVYRHCWFIDRNLSAYSSANNHLIGEAAGLFIAGCCMPQFKTSGLWTQKAFGILVEQCRKQNYSDGVNKEQAISYQQFVLDFLILSGLAGKANNLPFPHDYWFTVKSMLVYLAAMEDNRGNLPKIGDEDDGYVFDAMQKEYGVYRSLLNTGAYMFGRSRFLKDDREIDQKTLLLLNIGNLDIRVPDKPEQQLPDRFEQGGYYLLGTGFNTPFEQKLIFDCGSLGYLSIAAHGHADALSFHFSAGGYPIFVDTGTYAYHADKYWRNYFRGTSAHNTIRIDGRDQSQMAGSFMWSRKANAAALEYEVRKRVKGSHDGYKHLPDGVMHVREIVYREADDLWEIRDSIKCRGRHEVELFFHIHPDCAVEENERGILVRFPKGHCLLEGDAGLEYRVYRGDAKAPLGWYSPSYDVKVSAATVRYRKEIQGSTEMITRFRTVFYREKDD